MTATTVLNPFIRRHARRARLGRRRARPPRRASTPSAPPRGEVLVAEVDGTIEAAIQVDDGTVFADPFAPTAGLIALLELRAGRAKRQKARRGLAERLRLRPVPRARAA